MWPFHRHKWLDFGPTLVRYMITSQLGVFTDPDRNPENLVQLRQTRCLICSKRKIHLQYGGDVHTYVTSWVVGELDFNA